jgi:hypothetical protein
MTRWKTTLLSLCAGIVGIALGSWASYVVVNKRNNETHDRLVSIYIQDQIRILELLSNNENDKAVRKLESRLNTWILTIGPNPYHPEPLSDDAKSSLQLAAKHREKYPFTTNSPGVDQMVKNALNQAR